MAMIQCEECKTEISKSANVCPKCGHPNKKAAHLSAGQVIIALFLSGIAIWFFAGGGLERQAKNDIKKIQDQVAVDAVAEYNIAKSQGDKTQICVQAGLVSAAYLQAKDKHNYNKWKDIQKKECSKSGMPQ